MDPMTLEAALRDIGRPREAPTYIIERTDGTVLFYFPSPEQPLVWDPPDYRPHKPGSKAEQSAQAKARAKAKRDKAVCVAITHKGKPCTYAARPNTDPPLCGRHRRYIVPDGTCPEPAEG